MFGHGVQPNTDPGVLEQIVAHVHEQTSTAPTAASSAR